MGWCEDRLDADDNPVPGCDAECWGAERMSA